ncbi:MAG TPA: hypothetical protein ENH94_03945 [Phycisphaerales bacterium]|nr:hypothetical protein [Phycisphaerales bacterium]
MATEKQINANRQNSLKSTGPNTPEGKSAVAQNSFKHGMYAAQGAFPGESQAEFDLHRDRIFEEYHPESPTEIMYTHRIASLSWRLRRSDRVQLAAVNSLHHSHRNKPVIKLPSMLRPKKDDSPPPPDLELGDVIVKDFADAKVLDSLLMYERRIENSLYKAILEMQRLKMIKKLDAETKKNEKKHDFGN